MFQWTIAEVMKIIDAPKLVQEISPWKQEPGSHMRSRMQATIAAPWDCPTLSIRGVHGPAYWGFSFLIASQQVRRFDRKYTPHRNPDGVEIVGPHKHTWDETHLDRVAYIPDDIDIHDVNNAFADFLTECNIAFGDCIYQRLMIL